MPQSMTEEKKELSELCDSVKNLAHEGSLSKCEKLIADAMGKYPHAPQPHNLMGVLFEIRKDHAGAIKHFRAAWSLDPTYIPARHNLENFASFYTNNKFAFDENDCQTYGEKHNRKS